MSENIKNIDELIEHLNNNNISTNEDNKLDLLNFGYYHGYKGYRFFKQSENKLKITSYNQIVSLNKFDLKLKNLFYPLIMYIETALKSRVLFIVVEDNSSSDFNNIYDKSLNYYKSVEGNDRKKAYKNKLFLRKAMANVIVQNHSKSKISQHFYDKDYEIPIWGLFEMLTLGEFGNFVKCLNKDLKIKLGLGLKINRSFNSSGELVEKFIFAIKDLRNAISHNEPTFDTRFKSNDVNKVIFRLLENETDIKDIDLETVVDYLILLIYLLKNLNYEKAELIEIVEQFEKNMVNLKKEIEASDFFRIFNSNTRSKLAKLKDYINK